MPVTSRTLVTRRTPPTQPRWTIEVDGVGDEEVGDLGVEPLPGHRGVHGEAAEDALRRVGVDRAHRAVVALAHGQEHGKHLGAPHLADDHPVGVHPKAGAHDVGEGERADALGVGLAGLEGLVVGMEVVEVLEADLERVLDRDEPLLGAGSR